LCEGDQGPDDNDQVVLRACPFATGEDTVVEGGSRIT